MELNNNLISVQGILIKHEMHVKLSYIGGNERHILDITTELANFLTSKSLWEDKKVPLERVKDVNDIVLFLALQTEFKRPINMEEFAHLSNIAPKLSKCLLANICFALNLLEQYGFLIETLPMEVTEELLDQVIEFAKKGMLKDHPHKVFIILKSVVNKLSSIEFSYKTEDIIGDITGVSTIILQNLTNITTDQVQSMKALNIYQHMGITLLNFFKLLLYIDENKKSLQAFLISIASTTCNIIKCVTIDVFCSWVEVDYQDQSLQTVIANNAYWVMEKFQKNKLASELIAILGSMARKPKTIAERIIEADISTVIKMVNNEDQHQKLWFSALFNKPVFSDPKIVECIERWWQLCDGHILDKLFQFSMPKTPEERQLFLKCASNIKSENLVRILTIHFNQQHFPWREDTTHQLVLVFNQINSDISEEDSKQVLLLLLQNARAFFHRFYTTAFKRSPELIKLFELVKYVAEVDKIGLEMLMEVLRENAPTTLNVSNYIQLFNTMISCQYYSWDFMIAHVLLPLLKKYDGHSHKEEFKCCVKILEHFKALKCELTREMQLYEYILTCASENRCKTFLEFNSVRNEITSLSVDYLLSKYYDLREIEGKKESFPSLGANIDDPWSNYYKSLLLSDKDSHFVDWILPNFDMSSYKEGEINESFTRLLKILPRCSPAEWNLLLSDISKKYSFSITVTALSDIMILLCDFTENQSKHRENEANNLLVALQFCLQNYGKFLLSDPKTRDQKILVINSLCRVLKHIPEPLKPTEGMSLIHALPEDALKLLAEDKEFVARIILINDKELCKALAQKVLASNKEY